MTKADSFLLCFGHLANFVPPALAGPSALANPLALAVHSEEIKQRKLALFGTTKRENESALIITHYLHSALAVPSANDEGIAFAGGTALADPWALSVPPAQASPHRWLRGQPALRGQPVLSGGNE